MIDFKKRLESARRGDVSETKAVFSNAYQGICLLVWTIPDTSSHTDGKGWIFYFLRLLRFL